jgi:RNA polymerase primary sigma factor
MESIKLYIKAIKDIPLLTADEEISLAHKIKKGSQNARKKMIQANLRLVISIAKHYSRFGVPLMDIIEEGNIGLMKAVKKYNPSKGYRFSTYAAWWIKQYITRAIADQGKTIRIPVYMTEKINKWKKVRDELSQKYERKPKIKEIAKKMRLPIKKVKDISKIVTKMSSLSEPVGEDGAGQFIDLIEDEVTLSPIDSVSDKLRREGINTIMDTMNVREKKIIDMRFGLTDGINHTLRETANIMQITRERVRQIESSALEKLKKYIIKQTGEIGGY